MHNYPKKLAFIMALTLLLSGCGNAKNDNTNNTNNTNQTTQNTESNPSNTTDNSSSANADFAQNASDMFTERDLRTEYDQNASVSIELNNTSASCNSDTVKIDGSTITIQKEGTYVFSGNLDDGMIIADTDDSAKLQLVFNGVTINSETSAPLYILEADKVFLTLAEGTANTLSNGGTFTAIDENSIDSVIFSKQDLTINGSGSLIISSPAGHGIVSKDDLVLTGGDYTIGSASHGLSANDSVRITNASITIAAGNDGIQADNEEDEEKGFVYIADGMFNLETAGDGISASSYVQIENGTFAIASGDDAVHAEETLTITSGTMDISESYEGLEGLNISISGGNIFIYASGDGIDANGYLEITGGDIIVTGPTQGDTAILDYDSYAAITGGSFIGVGSTMMAQTFSSNSTQGCFAVTCGNVPGGTALTLTDSNGKEVVSYTPETAYSCIILSNPTIQKGETYTITVGEISGEFEAN
uniref:carbohydrate-binding domain-containing protein n=1 Tax=Agathobacter sp. TaxID=2021311 RepID=UPI004056ADDB